MILDIQELYLKYRIVIDPYGTEGAEVEEIILKGFQGYIWKTDEMTYLIWHQYGVEFHIVGNLNKDEISKVAKNILK